MDRNIRTIKIKHLFAIKLFLILLLRLGLSTVSAQAHEGAEIVVSPSVVAPGEIFTVKGEGVEAGETFTISLDGITYRTLFGDVTAGSDEDFHEEFELPADTPPGPYQVVATSVDGETITAELTVEVGTVNSEPVELEEPSNGLMKLDRKKSGIELGVIIVGLIISTGLGIVLVRVKE
jgi:hypothetical protein